MKDSQGRYWCIPCGEADQRRKAMSSTTAPCAGCHKPFPKGKLDKHGEHFFCPACLKKRTKSGGTRVGAAAPAASPAAASPAPSAVLASSAASASVARAGGSPAERRRVVVMAALLLALVVFSLLFNFIWAN
jgi:hypothetical protein